MSRLERKGLNAATGGSGFLAPFVNELDSEIALRLNGYK
jgi:hypothetical protein